MKYNSLKYPTFNPTTLLLLFLSCLLLGFLGSCQKTSDLAQLKDSFTLRKNGADMPVYVFGNASEKIFLLTLHGGPVQHGLSLRTGGWSDDLEEKYAVVYWDQRGGGMAQGDLSEENFNLEAMQEDADALIRLLKHKYGEDITLFLYGQSWGSTYGSLILLEADNQDLFNGWISSASNFDFCSAISELSPAYTNIANEQIAAGHDTEYWNDILDLVADTDATDCRDYRLNNKGGEATDILQKRGVINTGETGGLGAANLFINNNFIAATLNTSFGNDFLFEDDDFADLSVRDQLSEITLPTLVLHGKYDLKVAFETGESYYNLLGSNDKTFVGFEASGHEMMYTETEKYGEAIIDFIELHK